MRLALVSTYPPGKGSLNEYAYHFVHHLRQKPEVSELLLLADELPPDSPKYTADPASPGVCPMQVIPCWRFGDWRNAWRIRQAIARVRPDAVLFNIQFASFGDKRIPASLGLLAPWFARSKGAVVTVLLHNIMETVDLKRAGFGGNPVLERITRTAGNLFTRLLLRADLVAVTIPKYVEILTEKYKVEHVFLAPHGSFTLAPEPSFELPPGSWQIMTFGKFGTYKRVEALIEAFDMLQRRMAHPLELVIAGTDSPNAAGYLDSMRQRYAQIPNIRFTGYVEENDVPHIFQESAVVVFPYNSTTGSSGVLHQAGSYAKAVVLPRLGDFAELISEEGYTGEFFEPENAASLADAIQKLLDNSDYRRDVGLQNYAAAVGLPMTEVVDWYLLHFERLLKDRQSH